MTAPTRKLAAAVARALAKRYPEALCALAFDDPWECLASTVLSAQCTDKKVNEATPALFARFPGPAAFAAAEPSDVEPLIRSLGLFRAKARHLVDAARALLRDHGGAVPSDMDALTALTGVGRKTANCVRVNAFGLPGLMCDTHVCRVTRRLGLHDAEDPEKVEAALAAALPPAAWGDFSHRVILHGRAVCHARKPDCPRCPLRRHCRHYREISAGA